MKKPLYGNDEVTEAYILGNYELAEKLCRERLAGLELLGFACPQAATELHRLAQILETQGKNAEALKLHAQVRRIVEDRYS